MQITWPSFKASLKFNILLTFNRIFKLNNQSLKIFVYEFFDKKIIVHTVLIYVILII